MAQNARIKIEMPVPAEKIRLPRAVDSRLKTLLDKQDRGEKLTAKERKEAEGLVELAEMLTLMRLRSERVTREGWALLISQFSCESSSLTEHKTDVNIVGFRNQDRKLLFISIMLPRF